MSLSSSIQFKILAGIASVFLTMMAFSTWFTMQKEKEMAGKLAIDKAKDIANSYFDAVNTMMLTGTMQQNKLLREKSLSHPDIEEIRLIRANPISEFFGPGSAEQAVRDELDARALNGDLMVHQGANAKGRAVTVVVPIRNSSNFRGTNCLSCHAGAEGTVLGAVRVTYSLAATDHKIHVSAWTLSGINAGLLLAGMALIFTLMKRIVVSPLTEIRNTMGTVQRDCDLTRRLSVEGRDEIAQLSRAFNDMLGDVAASLDQVSATSHQLNDATRKISAVAGQTTDAVMRQTKETDSVLTAIKELEASVREVRSGAQDASDASIEADRTAASGAQTTRQAIDGIFTLVSEIERAAEVIKRLDRKSKGVGAVLDVIKGLAEQTNLLALNAAIEAARAGDQGRGFAVVADEVRTLATRSHQATEEIENIVEQLQVEAREAVSVMEEAKVSAEQRREQVRTADQGLNVIAGKVTHIRELNMSMSKAADRQSSLAGHVAQSVDMITRLAEGTSQDAKQTDQAGKELVALSNKLAELVGRFKR